MIKRRKLIVLFVFLGAAAGVAVTLFFLLSPKNPTLTVNGENIPVKKSSYISMLGTNVIALMGEKGNDVYFVNIRFMEGSPTANTTYNLKNREDLDRFSIGFEYCNSADKTMVLVRPIEAGFSDAEVSVGNFTENEKIGISVSGKLSKDGYDFDFYVSGEIKYSDYKEIFG